MVDSSLNLLKSLEHTYKDLYVFQKYAFKKREVIGAEGGDSCGMKRELEIHLR
ncbi:hypothetical protein [Jeotgalibacillus proteolyticus]|uniref:hypothetical protein n=1 Tax=Jeotgalibacillus proteolyticus TaxID=2082395 RepID=UPI001430010F|nr:hypothetical protein [Jeotgalibacillus proteolyticus]